MALSKTLYLLLNTGSTQEDRKLSETKEDRKSSGQDRKIVDRDVKHQNKQTKQNQIVGEKGYERWVDKRGVIRDLPCNSISIIADSIIMIVQCTVYKRFTKVAC